MDAKIKRVLCESAEEKWTFICEDGGVEYYTSGEGLFSASEEQLRTGKGDVTPKSIGGLAGQLETVKDMYEASQKDIIL